MVLQLLPAGDDAYAVVSRLCGYYIYDMSEYLGWACPESGRFSGCDDFFADWQAGRNYVYLLRVDDELAGFAGVGIDAATREFFIQEFFLLRKFRRRGLGRAAAWQLFDRFAGPWRVELLAANLPAAHFWPAAVRAYPDAADPVDGERDSPWGPLRTLHFTHPLAETFDFTQWTFLRDGELEVHLMRLLPPNPLSFWLPCYDCEMRVDGVPAGNINLRVGNTAAAVLYAGHIGYGVFPAYRGHHYAERACRLLFPLAQSHGLDTLWITTNPDNAASRRTCERLGARLVEILPLPEDTDPYRAGDREKCRYRLEV